MKKAKQWREGRMKEESLGGRKVEKERITDRKKTKMNEKKE